YMRSCKEGYTQAAAAARSGFSERTGRRIGVDPVLPSQRERTRRYRTRQDPFAEVWREELVPLLQAMPSLRATTLLEELQRHHPGGYPDQLLRSLQRRVAHWRATEGPERELIFRQEHPPGLQALSDFTDGGGPGVTLDGGPADARSRCGAGAARLARCPPPRCRARLVAGIYCAEERAPA